MLVRLGARRAHLVYAVHSVGAHRAHQVHTVTAMSSVSLGVWHAVHMHVHTVQVC